MDFSGNGCFKFPRTVWIRSILTSTRLKRNLDRKSFCFVLKLLCSWPERLALTDLKIFRGKSTRECHPRKVVSCFWMSFLHCERHTSPHEPWWSYPRRRRHPSLLVATSFFWNSSFRHVTQCRLPRKFFELAGNNISSTTLVNLTATGMKMTQKSFTFVLASLWYVS